MWPQSQGQRNAPVTGQMLEERINMYISAMDKASAMNNGHQSTQLQRDIQQLVDLMERVSTGQIVTELEVPPPLVITPQTDVLANPLGELSSRLAEYHKALYFAEEELSDDRLNKIQRLQKGLQTIHGLQKHAQAGFPVRADEIPPPVAIPSDDEFDPDAVSTLQSRLSHYKATLSSASQSVSDRRKIPKIESAIRTIEFLLTRAKAKRPVWKRDIPPEFDYYVMDPAKQEARPMNKTKFILQIRSLQKRVQNISFKEEKHQEHLEELNNKLKELEAKFGGAQTSAEVDNSLTRLTKEVEALEKIAFTEKTKDLNKNSENLSLVEMRLSEYKAAALASKQDGQVNHTIQHWKVMRGLQALKEALERGEFVDMTLVPPPPRQFTPTRESPPPLPELSSGVASTETSQISSGVTAHLSPVNIKPAVESAEDKLAKKLFTYLDKGNNFGLSASEQMMNIHNNNIEPPTQLLPKVQNSENDRNNLCNYTVVTTSLESASKEDDQEARESEKWKEKAKQEQLLVSAGSVDIQPLQFQHSMQALENVQNNVLESKSFLEADNTQSQESEDNKPPEEQKSDQNDRETHSTSLPSSSHATTADVYVRKTLGTLDFLSCQNVLDGSAEPEVRVSVPIDSNVRSDSDSSASVPADQQGNVTRQVIDDGTLKPSDVDSSSHNFSSQTVQSDQSVIECVPTAQAVFTSSVPDTAQSELVLGEHLASIGISDYPLSSDWDSARPSSITLPVHSNNYTQHMENGPSSLPVMASTHIPDIVKVDPSSLEVANVFHRDNGTVSFDQHSEATEGQETSATFADSKLRDVHVSRDTDSKKESNRRNSPDTLEFQDLMESMTIPSFAEPVSLIVSSLPPSEMQSNEHKQLESPIHGQRSDIMPEQQNFPNEVSAADSGNLKTDTSNQENHYAKDPSFASSYTPPASDERNKGTMDNTRSSDLSISSKLTSVSDQVSKDYHNKSPSLSLASDQSGSQQQTIYSSDNWPAASGSNVLHQNLQNFTSGNNPAVAVSDSQLQNSNFQSQNWTLISSSHSQPVASLSKSQNGGKAWQASAFTYSEVAFTCLENLKYDCLLSLAKPETDLNSSDGKGVESSDDTHFFDKENIRTTYDTLSKETEESKQEEKKLRAKFDLIKNKLRLGGKRTWEVYKACVEREHASLIQQIEDLCLLQQWNDVKLLSQKKDIAERELVVLRERLPQLKY